MKTLLVLLSMVFSLSTVYAEEKASNYKPFECPTSHITDNDKCLNCHIKGNFKVKETAFDDEFTYPNRSTRLRSEGGKIFGRFFLTNINDRDFRDALDYFYLHNIDKIVIDIHSPGGSLFNAWRIKGMTDEAKANGILVQTRLYGIAASAGFLLFCSGDERIVHPQAEGMWHELMTGEFMAIKTPSDKEDEAKVLRHLQDTANEWIASKATVSKDVLDARIRKKEFWVNGKEMFNMGFATELIGK